MLSGICYTTEACYCIADLVEIFLDFDDGKCSFDGVIVDLECASFVLCFIILDGVIRTWMDLGLESFFTKNIFQI